MPSLSVFTSASCFDFGQVSFYGVFFLLRELEKAEDERRTNSEVFVHYSGYGCVWLVRCHVGRTGRNNAEVRKELSLTERYSLDEMALFYIHITAGVCVNIGLACDFFVYYNIRCVSGQTIRSFEYRQALRAQCECFLTAPKGRTRGVE